MNLRERIALRLLGIKATPYPPAAALVQAGQAVWSQWDYESYAREAYGGNPYVFRAVSLIAQSAAGITPLVQRQQGNRMIDVEPGDPIARLIAQPSAMLSWAEWLEAMIGSYLLAGQAYAAAIGPDTGPNANRPQRLIPLRPDHCRPIPVSGQVSSTSTAAVLDEVAGFEYQPQGVKRIFAPEDVLWIRAWNPLNAFDGQPAIGSSAKAVDVQNEAMQYNYSLLHNGGFPSSLVLFGDTVTQDQARQWIEAYRKAQGAGNSAPIPLGGDVKDIKQGVSPKDGELSQTMQDMALAISLCTGVPPELLGVSGHKTFSNYREARKALYTEAVLPLLDRFLGNITGFLRKAYSDERLVIGYDADTIEALQTDRVELWERVQTSEFLTVNEKREQLGWEKVPGGDVILVPAGKIPLEAATGAADVTDADLGIAPATDQQIVPAGAQGAVDALQDTALNGAQVQAAIDIVARVARRELPRETGIGMLMAFFNLTSEQAERIMGDVGRTFFVEVLPANGGEA